LLSCNSFAFSASLWEVVGTPVERTFNGDEMAYEVSYDNNNRVDEVIALKK
jgi:hypothetical protein